MSVIIKFNWIERLEPEIKTRGGDFERPDQQTELSGSFTLERNDKKGNDVYTFWRLDNESYEIRYVTSLGDQQPYVVAPDSVTNLQAIVDKCRNTEN